MFEFGRTKTMAFWICALVLFLQISGMFFNNDVDRDRVRGF